MQRTLFAILLWAMIVSPCGADAASGGKKMDHRIGIVVFQFDDSTIGHYTYGFRILEKYNQKGSFGVVTGHLDKPGRLTSDQVREMHKAGHEIHDHTLFHEAAFWGNPANEKQWPERIEKSLAILEKLGVKTRGWNEPGGKGQGWSEPLRRTLAKHYDYAAGRVGLPPYRIHNMHWHLKDDPLSLGRGGIGSWGYNGGKGDSVKETECVKTRMTDGIQHGLVVIPLWHVVKDEDGTAQGLEEICKFVRENNLPWMVMADAVKAVQNPRDHFDKRTEQMPNPTFASDIDKNDRPDGFLQCGYAPPDVKTSSKNRAAAFENGTGTWIYGPEPGRTEFAITARLADETPRTITPIVTFIEIDEKWNYTEGEKKSLDPVPLSAQWQEKSYTFDVGEKVDRVKIDFRISPPGKVHLCRASWRKENM
ncbi:MAG: polysaccharide deacetylase family protein [Planctomycetota bacterium]